MVLRTNTESSTNTAGPSTNAAGSGTGPEPKFAFAAPAPPPLEEAAFRRLHKGRRAAFGCAPPFVESIMGGCAGAGQAASTPKH